jgi:hypothetical protein
VSLFADCESWAAPKLAEGLELSASSSVRRSGRNVYVRGPTRLQVKQQAKKQQQKKKPRVYKPPKPLTAIEAALPATAQRMVVAGVLVDVSRSSKSWFQALDKLLHEGIDMPPI